MPREVNSADSIKARELADPTSLGLDTTRLDGMADAIARQEYQAANSVLIARSETLAFERYFNGFDASSLMNTRSTTKSVTGMLIGIAIDRGSSRICIR